MKYRFDHEIALELTKAMTIAGGWMFGWTGLLLLLALM